MHGRLKIKTTAEQQEEKRKERQKKLKIFRVALTAAFKKISSNEYDEDGMNITKQILAANSDYTTLWNYRKKALKYFKNNKEDCESLLKAELVFIESCLRNNPKSYGCWHQRCFVMLQLAEPNWKKELHLTDLFLQLDDRNFHCWDYRRFLINHSHHPALKELEFTNTLIENNFSNYSSWHYRSKLLPSVYPDKSNTKRILEEKLIEELELVQNAFFTDPNDQSAWFYHRWLLGRGETQQAFLSMVVKKSPLQVTCTFRRPVQSKFFDDAILIADEIVQEGEWKSLSSSRYSHSWVFFPSNKRSFSSVNVKCEVAGLSCSCLIGPMMDESASLSKVTVKSFRDAASDATLLCLKDELNSCNELNDLEPGNKWVLLTIVLLMKALNPVEYFSEIVNHLSCLQNVDTKRSAYYADLQSRYQIENLLVSSDFGARKAEFANKNLTRLCHTEFLTTITHLDISCNMFVELGQPFALLLFLKTLQAKQNKISSIGGLRNLSALRDVDLSSNEISSQDELAALSTCSSLHFVSLIGNPLQFVVVNAKTKAYTFDVDLPMRDEP